MEALEIEIAVAKHFGWRRNIIVPNVSWGLGIHECDLLIVRKSGWAEEVEIKVSASDIKADLRKSHGHRSCKIKRLWFAVPADLVANPYIPARAGIISVAPQPDRLLGDVAIVRKPEDDQNARKLTDREMQKVLELGVMRVWSYKEAYLQLTDRRARA